MAKEVCLFDTAELETTRVVVSPRGGIEETQIWDICSWLNQNDRPGVYSWRGDVLIAILPRSAYGNASIRQYKSVSFHISDTQTAMEFKLRWA